MLHHPFARLTADRRSSHCFHYFRVSRYTQLQIVKFVMIEIEVEIEVRILMEMKINLKIERKMEVQMELQEETKIKMKSNIRI